MIEKKAISVFFPRHQLRFSMPIFLSMAFQGRFFIVKLNPDRPRPV